MRWKVWLTVRTDVGEDYANVFIDANDRLTATRVAEKLYPDFDPMVDEEPETAQRFAEPLQNPHRFK